MKVSKDIFDIGAFERSDLSVGVPSKVRSSLIMR